MLRKDMTRQKLKNDEQFGSCCLKKVKINKFFLLRITPRGKDLESFGCSLCHPCISWLVQVIVMYIQPLVLTKRFLCQSVRVFFFSKFNVIYSFCKLTVSRLGTNISQIFTNVSCLRSYHRKKTRTHSIPEVKPCRAMIIIGWLTAWKYLVLQAVVYFFLFTRLKCFGCFRT